MRWPLLVVCAAIGLLPVSGEAGAADLLCLSSGEAAEAVTSRKVVAPGQAIVLARKAVPNAEILRAALCRDPDVLAYRITLLRRDGRMVRVTVDAPSGKVKRVD